MLSVRYGLSKQGITVPYDRKFQGVQKNAGFVDVRGRPDLAAEISEAAQSDSLRVLLMALAEPAAPVFTLGCDLGMREEPTGTSMRYVAGGYVQVMSASFASASPDDYLTMAEVLSERVDGKSAGSCWELEHLCTPVDFRLGRHSGIVPSIQIWFDAKAETREAALLSREVLVDALCTALTAL